MKKIVITVAIMTVCMSGLFAQTYMTRTGKVTFDASSPSSPEKVAGINNEVASIVNGGTGEMVFQIFIKSFKLEKELMQEHFNENYMESDKFPKAEFKGNINAKSVDFTKDGSYTTSVSGTLTIHGVGNQVTVPGTVVVKGNNIKLSAKFKVKLTDYKITIPSLVADKLGKEATINVDCDLVKK